VHGCRNIVTKPIYFKSKVATLIYVVFTNVSKSLLHIAYLDCDLSDVHHMACFATKMHLPIIKKRHIIYRSYKHFSEQTYTQDLSYIGQLRKAINVKKMLKLKFYKYTTDINCNKYRSHRNYVVKLS